MIFFFHKGGFTVGSPYERELIPSFINELNAVVVSVNYPLSPAHRFPTAHEYGYETVRCILENQKQYFSILGNVHYEKIILGGFSAGANLAMTVIFN